MQAALDQMNLKLHHFIDDLTGMTGLAIVEAILDGERDPRQLAKQRDHRIKASEETIVNPSQPKSGSPGIAHGGLYFAS